MAQVYIKDVVGPMFGALPLEHSCFIVGSAQERMFGIQCSFSDAEICQGLLEGNALANPYDFSTDILAVLDVKIAQITLEIIGHQMYGKIILNSDKVSKPMRMVCSNPCSAINMSLAAKVPIEMDDQMIKSMDDATIEYHRMKACIMQTWPMPQLTSTDHLRIFSEFMDKVQYRQAV